MNSSAPVASTTSDSNFTRVRAPSGYRYVCHACNNSGFEFPRLQSGEYFCDSCGFDGFVEVVEHHAPQVGFGSLNEALQSMFTELQSGNIPGGSTNNQVAEIDPQVYEGFRRWTIETDDQELPEDDYCFVCQEAFVKGAQMIALTQDPNATLPTKSDPRVLPGGYLTEPDEKKREVLKLSDGCPHYFHVACVEQWLKTKSSCCVCRYEFPKITSTSSHSSGPEVFPLLSIFQNIQTIIQRQQERNQRARHRDTQSNNVNANANSGDNTVTHEDDVEDLDGEDIIIREFDDHNGDINEDGDDAVEEIFSHASRQSHQQNNFEEPNNSGRPMGIFDFMNNVLSGQSVHHESGSYTQHPFANAQFHTDFFVLGSDGVPRRMDRNQTGGSSERTSGSRERSSNSTSESRSNSGSNPDINRNSNNNTGGNQNGCITQ